jgi:cell pole-organizing protein PopZ
MSEPNAPEPTMEEILASIRRIISEDEPAAEAGPAQVSEPEPEPEPVAPHEDVLELTERVPEPAAFETLGDLDVMPTPEPAPPPKPVAVARPAPPPEPVESLLSAPAAEAATFAFDQLSHSLRMPADGRTLEDVVRELLRPLLKTWLDENLPAIVQTAVSEEVERLSRRRV